MSHVKYLDSKGRRQSRSIPMRIYELEQELMVAKWRYPEDIEVDVTLDDGKVWRTKTRSVAWYASSGSALILLEGMTGGYLLERCKPVVDEVWSDG